MRCLFLILLIVLCNCSKKEQKQLKSDISIDAKSMIQSSNVNVFEEELAKNRITTISDIEKFISSTLNNQDLEWDYIATFSEGVLTSKEWKKITKETQAKVYVNYGKALLNIKEIQKATFIFEKANAEYTEELKKIPQEYLIANLDLAYCYNILHKTDISNNYTEKALLIAEKYKHVINPSDYLTVYNNLMGDQKNINKLPDLFEKYKQAKINYFDTVTFLNKNDEDFKEIVFKRFEIKTLFIKNDTANAYKKLKEFIAWKPKHGEVDKNNFMLSTFATFIDKFDFDYKEYNKSLALANDFYDLAIKQNDFPNYHMLALSKLARSHQNLEQYEKSNYYFSLIEQKVPQKSTSVDFYSLKMMKAINLSELKRNKEVVTLLDSIFPLLSENFLNKKIKTENLYKEDFKDLNSGVFINNFATASNLYFAAYKDNKNIKLLEKAESLALSAAKMFQLFYEHEGYDYYITNYSNKIAEALLNIAIEKYPKQSLKQREYIEIIEKNASQQLFNQFQQQVIQNNPKIKSLFDERAKLSIKKEVLENELVFVSDSEKTDQIKILESNLNDIEKQIKIALKNFSSIKEDFSIQNIQDEINVNECVLKFYTTNNYVYRLLIEKTKISIVKVESLEKTEKLVKQYLDVVKKPNQNHTPIAQELYKLFCQNIQFERINIIPQNFINYLPFETLVNPKGESLIDESAISYNFSLPLWYASRIYELKNANQKTLCLAADYTNSKRGTLPIIHSKNEVNQIAELTDGDKNSETTKKFFLENANNYTIYHLALHANLDDANFEQSNLLFTDDEPLYFKDFYKLSLPVDLVVLSACNTGTGTIVNGEGIMSLSRALTFSGTRSAVVSLWQVPDKETSEIMISFYENLKDGQSKDEALANAKRDFIENNPMKNHPFYWAGFVVNGDVSPIVNNYFWWKFLGVIGIIFLLVLLFFKWKSNNTKLEAK